MGSEEQLSALAPRICTHIDSYTHTPIPSSCKEVHAARNMQIMARRMMLANLSRTYCVPVDGIIRLMVKSKAEVIISHSTISIYGDYFGPSKRLSSPTKHRILWSEMKGSVRSESVSAPKANACMLPSIHSFEESSILPSVKGSHLICFWLWRP